MGVEGYNSEQMERLRDHKIPFDQEAIWATLQKKQKKRRGAFFFITMALVALAIVFLGYLVIDGQKGDLKENDNEWSSVNNNQNDKSLVNETAESELTNSRSDESNLSENAGNEVDRYPVENSDRSIKDQSDSKSVKAKSSSDTRRTLIDNETNSLNISLAKSDKTSQTQSSTKIRDVSSDITNPIGTPRGNVSNSKALTSQKSQVEGKENISNTNATDIGILNKLSLLGFPFLESLINYKLNLDHLKVVAAVTPPIIKPLKNYKLFVGVYGGIGYVNKSIDSTLITETNDKTLEEISIGLELKYQFRPNLYVSSGIEYWHVTDRRSGNIGFNIERINEEIRNVYELEEIAEGFLVTTTESIKHTMYQTLNVPLMVGYNTNNEHVNLFVEVGALYNFSVFSRGDLPKYDREVFIGSRNQITPQLALGASYRWTNGLEVFTRANWRGSQYVTRTNSEGFGERLKYSAIRGQVGLRVGF